MPRFLHNKRGIFLRCKVFNFRSFVSRDIFLVRADDRAFKFVTCRSADGMRNVVGDPVGIGAAWHCYEQVVGLYYLTSWIVKQPSIVMEAIAQSLPLSNVFLKIMSVMFI